MEISRTSNIVVEAAIEAGPSAVSAMEGQRRGEELIDRALQMNKSILF